MFTEYILYMFKVPSTVNGKMFTVYMVKCLQYRYVFKVTSTVNGKMYTW